MFGKNNTNAVVISTGTIVRTVLVLFAVYLFWSLRDLILVLLTSIVIASFIEAAIPSFKKIKIGRVFAVVIMYVLAISFLASIFYLFAPLLITEIYNFATFISQYAPGVDFLNYFHNEAFSGAKDVVNNLSHGMSIGNLLATSQAFITNLSSGFFTTLSVAFGSIFNVVLIVIISFYLSIQDKGIENFLRVILPLRFEEYVIDLWNRTRVKIGLWMKGQMLLGVLIAILTYLVLAIMGIQYALLLSIIAGLMELIPYGILIALVPAVSFSYLSGGMQSALMVLGAYLIIHMFEVYLFSPLVIKKVTGLSPLIIILAVLVGVELGSFWGLLLSIPGALLFMEIISDMEKHKTTLRSKNES